MISAETDGTGFCLGVRGVLIREAGKVSPPAPPPKARILDPTVMGMEGRLLNRKKRKCMLYMKSLLFFIQK